jgi:hypothetical protein
MRSGRKHNHPPVDVGRERHRMPREPKEGALRVDDSSPPPYGRPLLSPTQNRTNRYTGQRPLGHIPNRQSTGNPSGLNLYLGHLSGYNLDMTAAPQVDPNPPAPDAPAPAPDQAPAPDNPQPQSPPPAPAPAAPVTGPAAPQTVPPAPSQP